MNYTNVNLVGTCSLCGGGVYESRFPQYALCDAPLVPTCDACGATMKNKPLPIVEMEAPSKPRLLNE